MKLRTPLLGFIGLLAVGLVAMQLVQGDLAVTDAALRIGVAAAVLTAVERLVLPLARMLITTGPRKDP